MHLVIHFKTLTLLKATGYIAIQSLAIYSNKTTTRDKEQGSYLV